MKKPQRVGLSHFLGARSMIGQLQTGKEMEREAGAYRLKDAQATGVLQSMAGAKTDLWIAEDMLNHCIETDGDLHEMCEELEEACWTTAVIRYERCFSQRCWPAEDIVLSKLTEEQLVSHHYFRFLRDKMFGHGLGVGEDFEITAAIRPIGPGGAMRIIGVGPKPKRISSPGTDAAKEFLDLVKTVRDLVDPAFWAMCARLTAQMQQLPLDQAIKGSPIPDGALPWGKDQKAFRDYLDKAQRPRKVKGKSNG